MTKRQFMEELRSSLEGMVSQAVIQENMNYYEDISMSRSEMERTNRMY